MTKFARIVDSKAVDVILADSLEKIADMFNPDWLRDKTFVGVPDDTSHGRNVTVNADGSFSWGDNPPEPDSIPKPNNPGNPYFGKRPLPTKDFYALAWAELGTTKFNRLITDAGFLWIDKILSQITVVDPDDRAGQFLQILGYLTTTKATDGEMLLSQQDVAEIMGAWK